jgi:hypothetical protein
MAAPERFAETSDSSCNAGAVHTWHFSFMPKCLGNVRFYWMNSGRHTLVLIFSGFTLSDIILTGTEAQALVFSAGQLIASGEA